MTETDPSAVYQQRCGFVAVLGAPNAGKSTLVNALVGQKVAITSATPQTTRTRVIGVAIEGGAQIVLTDTPGIMAPRRRLERAMVAAAWGSAEGADALLFVVDAARGLDAKASAVLDTLSQRREPKLLVINKVDLVRKDALLALASDINARLAFDELFFVAAASGDGVADFKAHLATRMPPQPWHFPADEVSDVSERLLAAEITREQLFRQLRAELPHDSAVETEKFTTRPDGSIEIHQQVLVARDSQKAIVLGKGGSRIRAIGTAARTEIAEQLGHPCHLYLHVKVKPDWDEDRALYRDIGLDWVE